MGRKVTYVISQSLILLLFMSFMASIVVPAYVLLDKNDITILWDFSEGDPEEKKESDKKKDKISSDEDSTYKYQLELRAMSYLLAFCLNHHLEVITPPPEQLS